MTNPRKTIPPGPETKPKISVIVPIYNTEIYLEKCLRSIMGQSLREIEIICIDDASPDGSVAIVERLSKEDDRIVLIRNDPNRGLGASRNRAIMAARAEFLCSVDSDDWIMPEMLARLWEASGHGEVDITTCGMALVRGDGKPLYTVSLPERHFRKGVDEVDIFNVMTPSFCNKMIRKSLFIDHDIWFPNRVYFEDLATTPRITHFARTIRIIADPLYIYVRREQSISNSSSPRHLIDYIRVFDILTDFLETEGLMERHGDGLAELIGKNLHYHTKHLRRSGVSTDAGASDMRHMILMKLAYLQFNQVLRTADPRLLPDILLKAETAADLYAMLDVPAPDPAMAEAGKPQPESSEVGHRTSGLASLRQSLRPAKLYSMLRRSR